MDKNNLPTLIGLYLKGEASETQRLELEAWINQSKANQEEFDALTSVWRQTEGLRVTTKVDTTKAWEQFQNLREAPVQRGTKVIDMGRWLMRIAALLVVGLGIAYSVGDFFYKPANIIARTGTGEQLEVTLPDGSLITLHQNSRIIYPEKFQSNSREVQMEGEIFFDIFRDESKPFTILATNTSVQVLGTSFNVRSNLVSTEVGVATGIVAFYPTEQPASKVLLKAGEVGIYQVDSGQLHKGEQADPNYHAWHTKQLLFNNTPLDSLALTLSNYFPSNIELEKLRFKKTAESQLLLKIRH